MRIAVEGCCHGELDAIYSTIEQAQSEIKDDIPIDLLLICGDFQAIRNTSDLQSLAVPDKYRQLGGFHRYYSGERIAPLLTIVIGGNHEASNYMWELYHGGWLAPNIYYLGAAGSVLVNGLRICGASGIYKSGDYRRGRFERMPYDRSAIRSIYHTREYDISRLAQLPLISAYPTIVLSHDWPQQIEQYGDTAQLLRYKPYFKDEVASNTLGSPPLRGLLETLKPQYWFAAHLHVKFAALFKHNGQVTKTTYPQRQQHAKAPVEETNPDELVIEDDEGDEDGTKSDHAESVQAAPPSALIHSEGAIKETITDKVAEKTGNDVDESIAVLEDDATKGNPDEIVMEEDEENDGADSSIGVPPRADAESVLESASTPSSLNKEMEATKFLALSKCLPGQNFLQILDVPLPSSTLPSSPSRLTYDPSWLAVVRAFHPLLSLSHHQPALPSDPSVAKAQILSSLSWIEANAPAGGAAEIADVQRFAPTASAAGLPGGNDTGPGPWYTNPQTEAFCTMIGVENMVNPMPPEIKKEMEVRKAKDLEEARKALLAELE